MTTPDAVIVTGASSGIGQAMVEKFAANGIRVFAAVRTLSTVADHPLVTPVRLDITSAEEARAAADLVRDVLPGGTRLRAIVNNAGIAVGGPLEFLDLDEMRRQLEVNVVGQLSVTQSFLPLLREHGKGRIVFTSSIGGRVAAPFIGPYAASKHALNGMAESLRRELKPWGIGVSVLAPATVATPIWDKASADIDAVAAGLPPRAVELYGPGIESMRAISQGARAGGIPASQVAEAAHHAVFARRAKAEYLVGREARTIATASALLPYRMFDKAVLKQMSGA
ncbi:short-chain dehydrogenase/reductase [Aeromicrobium sp. A1-2]|uniref:SDR family oxidoreductase n=1 Tax=Aeromicrobium sp. A1-2 TaxID=2107713 RepID=UPI000E4F9FF0|nr:SDR family oxidoreductase [Aeromicrobium sp. A1-2]AXT85800.1 short-chain dehydrogenase/reductase [Aeromicrobium sp. A1-2]